MPSAGLIGRYPAAAPGVDIGFTIALAEPLDPSESGGIVATYVFKFVVTDVELSKAEQELITGEVGKAASLALAALTPDDATSIRYQPNRWWMGEPPFDVLSQLPPEVIQALQSAIGPEQGT